MSGATAAAGTGALTPRGARPAGDPLGVAALPGIGLAELAARADLQCRVDRKYLVPADQLADLLEALDEPARVLDIDGLRRFGYRSVYHDTPDLAAYHAAARRRRHRFKVRTRTYLDSGASWTEVKVRGTRGATVKHRLARPDGPRAAVPLPGAPAGAVDDLTDRDSAFAADVLGTDPAELFLHPTLVSRFDRTTLFLPASGARVTVDTDLVWSGVEDGATDAEAWALDGLAVLETKTTSRPCAADRALWRAGVRPVRVSKYGTGMAVLDQDLPATPWHRTLDRHVLPHLTPASYVA